VDDLAAIFVDAVALHRGVSADTVLSDFGQGGVFVGQHAVTAGLADRVGTFEQTLSGPSAARTRTTHRNWRRDVLPLHRSQLWQI
jgi:ClpP class serine protease